MTITYTQLAKGFYHSQSEHLGEQNAVQCCVHASFDGDVGPFRHQFIEGCFCVVVFFDTLQKSKRGYRTFTPTCMKQLLQASTVSLSEVDYVRFHCKYSQPILGGNEFPINVLQV